MRTERNQMMTCQAETRHDRNPTCENVKI